MLWMKKKIRAKCAGVVVSVRDGQRVRVLVEDVDGAIHVHFMGSSRVKRGDSVKRGKALGYE